MSKYQNAIPEEKPKEAKSCLWKLDLGGESRGTGACCFVVIVSLLVPLTRFLMMLKIKKIKIKDKNQFKIFTIVEGVHGMYAKTAQLC